MDEVVWDCLKPHVQMDSLLLSIGKPDIGIEILHMVSEFIKLGKLPKGINSSYMALFPKTKMPIRFFEYRPISLIHGLYKMVAKILSTRLKSVFPSVISSNQTAFIARRQILDGFMIAN